jgi:hypothetical protein
MTGRRVLLPAVLRRKRRASDYPLDVLVIG